MTNAELALSRRSAWLVRLPELLGASVFVAVTLLGLAYFDRGVGRFYYDAGSWKVFVPFLGASVVALAFLGVRYDEFQPILKASIRASAVGLLVLLTLDAPDFTLANPEAAMSLTYIKLCYWSALVFAGVAVVRPAFIVPTAIFILSTRSLNEAMSGLWMSMLDIRYMIDMALYLGMAGLFVAKIGPRIHPWLGAKERQNEIVGVAIGLHLANYFWSGVAKMMVGVTPWYWVFENKTFNRMPFMLEAGTLPYGHLPWLTDLIYHVLQVVTTPLNAVILIAQLFAIVAIFRMAWLKISIVLYDMLHIGIYVFGGTFFWPWIWNNATIWWAARAQKQPFGIRTTLACVLTILLGLPALKLNEAAWLGWFDLAESRQVHVEALTKDGRAVNVPNAFFLAHSYSIGHGVLGEAPIPGEYEWNQIGNSKSWKRNELSGSCPDPRTLPANDKAETLDEATERRERLQRFFSAHHAKMLGREASFGGGSYYLRLHHFPANPFQFHEFNQLTLTDVVAYRVVVKSACLDIEDGKVKTRKIWASHMENYRVN